MKERIRSNPAIKLSLALLAIAALGATGPAWAADTIDVIVQSEGSPDAVVRWVESVGGKVNVRYKNVTALAVSVPSDKLAALKAVAGVKRVDRDRIITLEDPASSRGRLPENAGVQGRKSHRWTKRDRRGPSGVNAGDGFSNPAYTGAAQIWNQTGAGDGTIVAVVDTGVARNVVLQGAVIGAPGFPEGYNSVPDGYTATDPGNNWHGTFVSGVIAGAGALEISDPGDSLYQAFVTQVPKLAPSTPGGLLTVPLMGQAPNSKIYPVKVFPHEGGGTSTSAILDGLDHVLTLKKSGILDIDIVNLSLGGPTLFDGHAAEDVFLGELWKANILVVLSAGNAGPTPISVGSPGTTFYGVTVGALDYPNTSRVLYEWLGLEVFGTPGIGRVMRPGNELRVANFSSRGPLSDGRAGIDLTGLGTWNIGVSPQDSLMWASGTSFSAPTVAGVAALLNAYWEAKGNETSPDILKNVLLRSANNRVVGEHWRSETAQGYGVVDAVGGLNALKRKTYAAPRPLESETLEPNILGRCVRGAVQRWQSQKISLDPSEVYDAVLEIGETTSKVTIELTDVEVPDNASHAIWPNALEVVVQCAKRSAFDPVLVLFWDSSMGKKVTIEIEDGFWTVNGVPQAYQPMEPGLMRISLAGDLTNESRVRSRMRVTRANQGIDRGTLVGEGPIVMGDFAVLAVDIPAGVALAQFDLLWNQNWSVFPTADLDLYVFDPDFNLLSVDGATLNSPERVVIEAPAEGTYFILVDGFELFEPDTFQVYVKTE